MDTEIEFTQPYEQVLDIPVLLAFINKFIEYVRFREEREEGYISFRDCNGILAKEEGYKSRIAEKARNELQIQKWNEKLIGTGKINQYAVKAMSKADNLVFRQQQVLFRNILNPERKEFKKEAEKALYNIFKGENPEEAFANAVKVFGAKYDIIAFLFFIKDDSRFLPVSPKNFDKSMELLNIDFRLSYNCNWDNYISFISIVSKIKKILEENIPVQSELSLIDAHSFLWILHEKVFSDWNKNFGDIKKVEDQTELALLRYVEGRGQRYVSEINIYSRSAEVAKVAKNRAKGICQLCGNPAPFADKKGNPYLEVHHIIWLSRGGKDATDNVAALCPNCHKKMHVVDDEKDMQFLLNVTS